MSQNRPNRVNDEWAFTERGLTRIVPSEETKPTEREIVSALAGELMTTCIQVPITCKFGVECQYIAKGDILSLYIYEKENRDLYFSQAIQLFGNDDIPDDLRILIKMVADLGGGFSMRRIPFTRQHDLKIACEYYREVALGNKTFEVRKNDRDFQVGDTLALYEHSYRFDKCSDNVVFCRVTYLLKGSDFPAIDSDYCVMGIKVIHEQRGEVSQ